MSNDMIRRIFGLSRRQTAQQPNNTPQSRRSAADRARPADESSDAFAQPAAQMPTSRRAETSTHRPAPQPLSPWTAEQAFDILLGPGSVQLPRNDFVSHLLNALIPNTLVVNTHRHVSRSDSGVLTFEEEAFVLTFGGMTDDETQIDTDTALDDRMRLSEVENERKFQEDFERFHGGSVRAMRHTIDALWNRSLAEVPAEGITPTSIAERDCELTYKLPALLLAGQLPKLCAGRGVISDVALFDVQWQKQKPASTERYASLLPAIYRHLLATHAHDAQTLSAALPTLVQRVSYLLETGDSEATAAEKQLTQLIQDAVHHICGRVLCETLGRAQAHLSENALLQP